LDKIALRGFWKVGMAPEEWDRRDQVRSGLFGSEAVAKQRHIEFFITN